MSEATAKAAMDENDNVFDFPQIGGKLEGTESAQSIVPAALQPPQGNIQPVQVAVDLPWYKQPKNWLLVGGIAIGGYLIYKSFQPEPPFIPLDDMDGVEPPEDFFADVEGVEEADEKPKRKRRRKKAKLLTTELAEALADEGGDEPEGDLEGAPEAPTEPKAAEVLPADAPMPKAKDVTPSEPAKLADAPKKPRKKRKMPPRDPQTGAFLKGARKAAKKPRKRPSKRKDEFGFALDYGE